MSHVTSMDLVINDLASLKKAAEALGLEFVEGQTTWKWFGRWVDDYGSDDAAYKRHGIDPKEYGKCSHALRVKGDAEAYEIGVIKNPKGEGWVLAYDFYGGNGQKVKRIVGNSAKKLEVEYALQRATKAARKKGYRVRRKEVTVKGVRKTRLVCKN